MKRGKLMTFFKSLMVAISTYSIIPVPNFEWNEKNMKYAICFFPVVGFLIGALVWVFSGLFATFKTSAFFASAILTCIPLLVTGGIHMDGFADTVDALSSHMPREKKLEILSDPHCGAFAVIYIGIYLILNTAFLYEIYRLGNLPVLCPVYVLSRCISALCAVNLPNARKNGMLSSYTKNANSKTVNAVMIPAVLICSALIIFISPVCGAVALCFGAVWIFAYCKTVKNQFGGVTGDTAGFFLQMFELLVAVGVWIGAVL